VKFGTGAPFNAAAVKWNFDRAANPDNKLGVTARIPTYASTEVVNDTTVRFKTRAPDPLWPRRVFAILMADPAEGAKATFGSNPGPRAGTGLFRIAAFDPGRSATLEANPEGWRGAPRLAKIEIKALPELGTVIAGLQTGEIDLTLLAADRVQDMVNRGLQVQKVAQPNIYQLWLTSNAGGPLADRRVREAIALCIDREAIIKELYAGSGVVASQWVGPDGFGHNPQLQPYRYDPRRARELLTQAGFPNGFTIKVDTLATSLVFKGMQEGTIGYLKEIGITADVQPLETNVFVTKILQGGKSPIIFNGVQYGPAFDADFALTWYSSKRTPADTVMYNNATFQENYDKSQTETDQAKRLTLLQAAMAAMHADFAGVPILQPQDNYVHSKRLQNFKPHPVGLGYVTNWKDVFVS
jgi:peptide/nickel transport system substrate-binding protein